MKKLLVISCYDSFLKASFNIASVFKKNRYRVKYFIYKDYQDIDARHFKEIGFEDTYESGWIKDLFRNDDILEFDAIMLSMEGPAIHKFYQLYAKHIGERPLPSRPVLFAGYVGIVYENFMQGFMDRQPLDVYYVNCKNDLKLFKKYCRKLKLPADNLVLTGLPMLDTAYRLVPERNRSSKALLFAGQPTVPKSFKERAYIIRYLVGYARTHPHEKIYFKPRHKPNQSTFHLAMYHYEDIFRYLRKRESIPSNFILTYQPILDLLKQVDLCLTVSSTAAFEALCMGIPVGFLADFGISEKYGNYYFADSGCLTTLNRLDLNNLPSMDPAWRKSYFHCHGRNTMRVFEAVDALAREQHLLQKMLPLRHYFKGDLLGDHARLSSSTQHKSDIFNKLVNRLAILIFRLLSKVSPVIYAKLLS